MLNHPEKFRELHREFCSANAKWFSKRFELNATSAWENRLETGLYELLCFAPIPEQPVTQFGVLAPLTKFYEEPLEDYKRLAVEAWTFLPMDFKRLVIDVLEDDRLVPIEPYHYWTDLLWFLAACLELNDSSHNDESKSEDDDLPSVYVMNPFYFSAIFIENFGLATDAPKHPDKCESIRRFFGSASGDTDNSENSANNHVNVREPVTYQTASRVSSVPVKTITNRVSEVKDSDHCPSPEVTMKNGKKIWEFQAFQPWFNRQFPDKTLPDSYERFSQIQSSLID